MITREEFLESLTTTEKRAYYSILSKIHEGGIVNISALCQEACISRMVYKNLINKMKDAEIATFKRGTAKGTEIEITHPELREEAKHYVRKNDRFY